MESNSGVPHHEAWNKGKIVGQKALGPSQTIITFDPRREVAIGRTTGTRCLSWLQCRSIRTGSSIAVDPRPPC